MSGYERLLQRAGTFAEVYRRQPGADRFGQPVQNHVLAGTYACRVAYGGINATNYRSGEIMTERYIDIVGDSRFIFLPKEADVSEQDEIRVVNEAGNEVVPRTGIYSVRPRYDGTGRIHHKEVVVSATRPSEFQHAGRA